MNIKDLEEVFKIAKENNEDVCIELTVPGRRANEFIIILNDNLDYKLDYYKNNYTEELVLNRCEDIKIINIFSFTFGKENKYNL